MAMRVFRRRFWDAERARELQAYLEQEIDDNLARGMNQDEAVRAAHRKLGNVTRIREDIYDMNTLAFVESAWQDLRYGARLLRRNPTFAIVAVLTLALGTGANAAIFQLVDAVRLRTLPVVEPRQLVEIRVDAGDRGRVGSFNGRRPQLTNAIWERVRDQPQLFSSVMAWSTIGFDLSPGGEYRPADGLLVSGAFFDTLGVKPARGRLVTPADDTRGCASPGAVISHAFWQREYGGDPAVLGRNVLLDGHRFDIIGVTEQRFFGVEVGRSFDVALPVCADPIFRGDQNRLDRRNAWFLGSIARLKPGQDIEQLKTELRAISAPIFRDTLPDYLPEEAKAYLANTLTADPASTGVSMLRNRYATPLWVLLSVTGLVLLIACANLANLMLARATARTREVTVRLAIGASRTRLVRQMLSESLLLALIGAAAGLLVSRWVTSFLVSFLSSGGSPLFLSLDVNWRMFAFTAAIAGAACLLFGLAPALRATSTPAGAVLSARGTTDSRERFTLRRMLVVVQVALSLVLLVGAILMVRSLQNLHALDPGFRADGVIVASLDLRRTNVPVAGRRAMFSLIVDRLKAVPGVDAAAETSIAPMSGSGWNERIVVDGKAQQTMSNFNSVGPEYFAALATPIIAGRPFTERDTASSPRVAVVNDLFVKTYLPGQDPIGHVFHVEEAPGSDPAPQYQIVGVVSSAKIRTLREQLSPIAYVAALQDVPDPDVQLVVHSQLGDTAIPSIARAIGEVNPLISFDLDSMTSMVNNTLTSERLMAVLSGFFGGLAVLIATIGLYGVMSYMVLRRRMEIGIRMALGADRAMVVRMVVRDAARLLAAGLGLGALLAVLGARSARALLYGLEPWDPVTLILGITGLGTVALLASWWPARRASLVTPTEALRE